MNDGMELWRQAQKRVEHQDRAVIWAMGFDLCQHCGEWFHRQGEEWQDCVRCGRFCPECAAATAWEWCCDCGLYYCADCYDGGCDVCQAGDDW